MLSTMMVQPTIQPVANAEIYREILTALDELPQEALFTLRDFVAFLRTQNRQQRTVQIVEQNNLSTQQGSTQQGSTQPAGRAPTVAVPIAQMQQLIGLLATEGGDALAETEALYN